MALRDVIEGKRDRSESLNEAEAKHQVILPILRALGWDDSEPSKVAPEFSVSGGKADYALLGPSGKPVAVIEAKAPGSRLEDHVPQVVRYAFHTGVDICVLTTGFLWWLYLPRERGLPAERRFAELKIKEDSLDRLTAVFKAFLAYDELLSGRAEQDAREALETLRNAQRLDQEFPRVWNEMLREPLQELIDLVGGRVLHSAGLRADKDRIVRFLRQEHGLPSPAPNEPVKRHRPQLDVPKPSRSPSPSKKPAAYILFGQRHAVRSWKEVWVGVAQRLYERHGAGEFERVVGSPNGRRSYVEIDPNLFGSTQNPERIGDSRFWIATHDSAQALERLSRNLLELLGHNKDDLRVLFD